MREETVGPSARSLAFEGFSIDVARSILLRDGQPLPLRRQSFDVLLHLVEARGRVVTNDELVKSVWAAPPAQPLASVVQCIKDIRRAMGSDSRWMIRTVPGAGYEFKAAVHSHELASAAVANLTDQPLARPVATSDRPPNDNVTTIGDVGRKLGTRKGLLVAGMILLVLVAAWVQPWRTFLPKAPGPTFMSAVPALLVEPLDYIGDEHRAFALLLGDQITGQLSRSPGGFELRVWTAIPAVNGRANAAAGYTLRGRVSGSGASRRTTIHLEDSASKLSLWSETFSAGDESVTPAVAAQIARSAAVQIRMMESRRPLPPRPEAAHYALLGRVLLESQRGREVNIQAMAIFDKAVALDSRHMFSLQGYARTRVAAVGNGWAAEEDWPRLLDEAQRAIDSAIQVNQRSIGAHLLRGVVERIKGNPDRSLASLEHARELNPEYPLVYAELGRTKIDLGRSREALADIERARELSPIDDISAFWFYWAGIAAAHIGDDEGVIQWMTKALQRNASYKEPLPWLSIAYARRGSAPKAAALIDEYMKKSPEFSSSRWLKLYPTNVKDVSEQRLSFARVLEGLGAPRATQSATLPRQTR